MLVTWVALEFCIGQTFELYAHAKESASSPYKLVRYLSCTQHIDAFIYFARVLMEPQDSG